MRRWLVRGLIALVALLAIVAAFVLLLAKNLAHPWVRQRVVALVRDSAGYELDYAAAELHGLTLTIEGLVVRGAKPLRALAPTLLEAERITAELALKAPQLRSLRIEHATLTVLVDERGQTSFDTPPTGKGTAKPPRPMSEQAASLLGEPLPVRHVQVEPLTAVIMQSADGRVIARDTLRGLSLEVDAEPVASGARLSLRTRDDPVVLTHMPHGQARGTLALTATATARELALSLHVTIAEQDLVPELAIAELARVEAHGSFANGQTAIEVQSMVVGDDAATAVASLTLPDQGAPRIHQARGDLDALHLLELASPWVHDISLRAGKLHYQVEELALDQPATQAKLRVVGELDGLRYTDQLALGKAKLELKAHPIDKGLRVEGHAAIDRLNVQDARADDVSLQLAGTQDRQGKLDGELALRFAALAQAVSVRDGALTLRARELSVLDSKPRGDLRVEARLASVQAQELTATSVRLRAHAPLLEARAQPAYSVDGTLDVDSVRTPELELPLHLTFTLAGDDPARGRVELDGTAGSLALKLDASRRADVVDYELTTSAPELGLLRPWLAVDVAQRMPLAEMATTLHSKGRVERLSGEPRIEQRSELRMQRAALDDLGARSLELELAGHGDQFRHQLHADLRVHGLHYAGQQRAHERVRLALRFDRLQPSLALTLQTDSQAALDAKLKASHGAVDYDVQGHLADLSPLAGLLAQSHALAGFDVSELDLELSAKGRLTGLIRRADARGIELMEDPLLTLGGEGTLAARSKNFRWAQGELAVSVPEATWKATLHGDRERRTIDSELHAPQIDGAFGSERVALSDAHDRTTVTLTGGVRDGVVDHKQRLTVRRVEQQLAGGYAVGELAGDLHMSREADGLIKIHELRVDNGAAGTQLSVTGGAQLSRDEQRLSVRTLLEQDLGRLPAFFQGQGKLGMDVALSSSDFRRFHAAAKLRLEGATVRLPKAGIALESMDGDLPVMSDFLIDEHGELELLRGAHVNPYAAQRFADQHPALGYRSFMSIARIETPYFSCAPFAANLEVARNIISLSQLELGVRKGIISGSGLLEYAGLDSKIDANLRASGVMSSHGEPFDGNAALTIGVRERSVEGRADILRIGRRHLFDLLDLQDPLHADAALNSVRRALRFGYPDRVRLSFQHGFANAGVDFGGLARIVKLKDIRGIPLGPLVERIMSTIQPQEVIP